MAIDIAYIDIDWYCLYWLILAIESCVVLVFWVRHPSARKLLRGKRLTLSLMLSEAGKINQQNKKSHGHGRLWCCDVCHSHSHSHTVQPSRCPMNRLDNKWQWFKSIEVDFQAVGFLMLGCSRCADFLFCLIHVIPGGSKKMTGVGSALLHLRRWDELQAKMKAEKEVPSSGGSVYIIQKDIWLHVAMAHHAQAMISNGWW